MSHHHNIKSISKDTGLTVNFIRRVINASDLLKNKHSVKSNNNELLFDDNGLVLFREAAKLKAEGQPLASIVKHLDQPYQTPVKAPDNMALEIIKQSQESIIQAHQETIRAKDDVLQAQKQIIQQLESKILLITDGKSPDQIHQEREALRAHTQELEQKIFEAERDREKLKELENKRADVLAKQQKILDDLAGLNWFQFGRKAELIKQLRELSQ